MVTSGLGHRFPEGYPVAIVESVAPEKAITILRQWSPETAHLIGAFTLLVTIVADEDIKRLHNSPNQIKEVVKQRLSSSQQNNDENKAAMKRMIRL